MKPSSSHLFVALVSEIVFVRKKYLQKTCSSSVWVPYDILEVLWMEIYNYDRSKTKLWCEKYLRGKQEVDLYSSFHETAKHNLIKVSSVPRSKGRPKFQLCPQQQLQMTLQVFRTNTVESQRFITCMSFCLLTTEKKSVLLQNHWLHYIHKIFWKNTVKENLCYQTEMDADDLEHQFWTSSSQRNSNSFLLKVLSKDHN